MFSSAVVKRVAIAGIAALVGSAVLCATGLRVNTTKSIPVGLYWKVDDAVEKGAYVIFCPPETQPFIEAKRRGYLASGFCPGQLGYMMKRVLAAKDDRVEIGSFGVKTNGQLVPYSTPKKSDAQGRWMHGYEFNRVLAGDEVLLMGDVSPISFDARYFGPVKRSQIKAVIRPVITW